jgi:hypothetical protein
MTVFKKILKVFLVCLLSQSAFAEMKIVDSGAMLKVAVNGGSDSVKSWNDMYSTFRTSFINMHSWLYSYTKQ